MKVLGIILLGLTTITGCKKQAMDTNIIQPEPVTVKIPADRYKDSISYLALGDSYTIGQSVPAEESFPLQLTAQLKVNSYKAANPLIIAQTGWTTTNLKKAIADAALKNTFTFVTLLIGVNNQYQHMDPNLYPTDFDDLLKTAIQFAGGKPQHVFVLSIPDYAVTPYASGSNKDQISKEIDLYNAVNADESKKFGVNYLNITGVSRQAATDPTLIAQDGLHPSGKMYKLWVQSLMQQVMPVLDAKP